MEKKIITESEMKELLESNENLDNHCIDLETARKIIMDAILPLCKWYQGINQKDSEYNIEKPALNLNAGFFLRYLVLTPI